MEPIYSTEALDRWIARAKEWLRLHNEIEHKKSKPRRMRRASSKPDTCDCKKCHLTEAFDRSGNGILLCPPDKRSSI